MFTVGVVRLTSEPSDVAMIPFSTSAFAHAANSSPSISMEKGAYRMRAPYTKTPVKSLYPAHSRRNRRTDHREPSSNLAMLVMILTLASISSFGMAYYLFATRWDTRELSRRRVADQRQQGVPVNLYEDGPLRTQHDPDEKFLAYLPHSGFHNQRIAFENALVLARLLNRTLLTPPIQLGNKPLRYVHFNALYHDLMLSNKFGLQHCSHIASPIPLPLECTEYFSYTQIPWDWLVDLNRVRSQQPLRQRWNLTEAWTYENLNISRTDVLYIKDSSPYHYRFLDTRTDISPSSHKYLESIYVPDLMLSTKRLIHVGTLFGSSRLRLKDPVSVAIRGAIRENMSFSNPSLLKAAKLVANSLGPNYLGAHLRLGDGEFKRNGAVNAREIWWHLVHHILQYTEEETLFLENALVGRTLDVPLSRAAIRHNDRLRNTEIWRYLPPMLDCRGKLHSGHHLLRLNTPLFISTDVEENNPLLARFRRSFPCIFYLSDFPTATTHLDGLYNPLDGVKMKQFMLPFLDALVVAQAWKAVGTENSTFSHFVQDVLWRNFHGLPIVQRG
ncbi:hypothetical protein D9615_002351 [Tricholomella constricta]|uniref:O-fucosyltransferase family protein n=1 Tax=Tricholomella constricta TaxID=117010 RepID=A0A8H5HM71_9AGAR|nr:hypothetical protein D9615_002351 [Tricholomella constricta]